jgi:copper chaperone CopZ
MKKAFVSFALLLIALGASSKDIKTLVVTTEPQMRCASCENKIKGNMRFEKGVKSIDCNIPDQRVTITYDADKTKPANLIKAFENFGYKATQVKKDENKVEKKQDDNTKKTDK